MEVKKIVSKKKFGKIVSVDIHHRYYLPYHHKYEDYKIGYAAKKSLGGGVVLSFIHEIDYANYLFGKPLEIFGHIKKMSNLNIDVEDTAKFSVIYNLNENPLKVNFNLDFVKRKPSRFCKIKFEKIKLYWDLIENKISFSNKKVKNIKSKFPKRNQLFVEQLKQVISSFKKGKQPLSNFDNGELSLRMAVKLKESAAKIKKIKLN